MLSQAVQPRDAVRPGTPLSAREVVASLLVRSGKAPDRRAALAYERRTSPSKLAEWLRSLSPEDVFAPYVGAPHLEFDLPSVVYDGVLLPAIDHRRLLARGGFAPVPLLIGGNRDEQKAYLWTDPLFVEGAGTHPVIRDPARYEVMNRLYSDWWTLTSVDGLLPRLRAPVYAYRFEWDDEPVAPVDLKALYGSAHGLELSFVFGDFRWGLVHDELPAEESTSVTAHPLQTLFNAGNAGSRERISEAMMAYWGEFARTGQPGRGGRADLPPWTEWKVGGTKIVFGNGVLSEDKSLLTERDITGRLWATPLLDPAQKCVVFLDNVMYPAYPLKALARQGCRR